MKPAYGKTNPPPGKESPRRCAAVIGLRPEMEARYRELHADVWQGVLDRLEASNVRNYSIFVGTIGEQRCLFAYYEYDGTDFEADMQRISEDPETRRWWLETDPCQFPLPDAAAAGGKWSDLERVFYAP
jgi:L-rhamnose mutarotase